MESAKVTYENHGLILEHILFIQICIISLNIFH